MKRPSLIGTAVLGLFLLGGWTMATAYEPSDTAAPQTLLTNPGFESEIPHHGWSLHVYGAEPELVLDTAAAHAGRQALRIHAGDPSDTALGQELQLDSNQWYRLTGWVRTDCLDPGQARTCGTFQIQGPGGREILATGRNHSGTNDWTQETLCFQAPDDGRVRVAVFFVGYGKGTGTAWFDSVVLQPIDITATRLTVGRDPLNSGRISPYQCGQFIEYLCALTLSMHAEKVFDGSFEGVPEYRFVFRKETDRLEKPWYPDGAVHRGEFALDPAEPFNGSVAQRIAQKPGDPCTLSVSQSGKSVEQGKPLRCSLYLRAAGVASPVSVMLWGEGATYASAEFQPTSRWQRFETTLTPAATDAEATFTIGFRGPGTLWIDQVSLMPEDNVFGWRRDVAEALKALEPGMIRFGGSTTEGFDWQATIGDRDRRVPFTTCWGGLEPGNAGLEEFVQLCRWVGSEPLVCVRFTGKQPKDAADQVEYFNGPPSSPMGKLRAANGHPEPYAIRYWQIGNELGDENYQQGLAAFCKAMKAVDPDIRLLAAFPSPGLLQQAGAYIDYICPHHYGCQQLAAMEEDIERCRRMIAQYAPGRAIRLAVTEWNTTAGDWGLDRAKLWTLDNALACSRYHHLMHRHCDLIEIANRSNLADSFCSGILQTNNHGLYRTPTYYAQQLYARHAGTTPLRVTSDSPLPADPSLDVSATLSDDGGRLAIFVVNSTKEPEQRTLDLTALAPREEHAIVWTLADGLAAGERDAANGWREPDRIAPRESKAALKRGELVHQFPALALTVVEVRLTSTPPGRSAESRPE